MTTEITQRAEGALQPSENEAERLIALAISREGSLDTSALAALLDMRREYREEQARAAYFDALSEFQTSCPPIPREKKGGHGKYSPIDATLKVVGPHLRKHGFSWTWNAEPREDGLYVTCTAHHRGGHSETSTVRIPGYQGRGTNKAQDEGAAHTYGRRYSFEGVFGLATTDDLDGAGIGPEPEKITAEQAANIVALISEVGANEIKFLDWLRVGAVENIPARDYDRAVSALERKRA